MSNELSNAVFRDLCRSQFPWFNCEVAVDDGWLPIVLCWLHEVQRSLDAHPGSTCDVVQVKEKMGELRIYSPSSADIVADVQRATFLAGNRALRTCEVCGKPGRPVSDGGWFAVRCPEHQGKAKVRPFNIDLRPPEAAYRYDCVTDSIIDPPTRTLAEMLEEASPDAIQWATIGPWRGLDLDEYHGWRDPIPQEKRGIALSWSEARPLLDYLVKPTLSNVSQAHPVTAWSETHVLCVRDRWGDLDIVAFPLEATGDGSSRLPLKGFV